MLSAFALTNCTQEIENPAQQPESAGYPFEIVASTVDTKTVNDGMHTKWTTKDSLNVFHAEAGATAYGTNDFFVISDTEEGRFKGNLTEAIASDKSYDWYVLYPYSRKITTPAATGPGFTYIGHSKGLNQTGYNSMAALKGSVCPLYGVAKAVAGSDMPSIEMNHISSVVAINVTNMNDEPLTITTASFTAPEDIVGSYYIDITKTPVECNPSGSNYVKSTAEVNVSNGTALKKGDSAIIYAAIKPFTAKAGQKLTLSVNGYPKELTLPKDVTFSAGKIKTLNFSYDYVAPAGQQIVTFDFTSQDELTALGVTLPDASKGTNVTTLTKGDVTLVAEGGSTTTRVWNSSGKYDLRAYKGATLTLSVPSGYVIDDVLLTGGSLASISKSAMPDNPVVLTVAAGAETQKISTITVKYSEGTSNPDPEPEPEPEPEPDQPESVELTVAEFLEKDVDDNVYYTLKGTITSVANTSYGNFDLTDDTGTVYIYGLCSPDGATNKYWATSGAKLGDDIVISVPRVEFNGQAQGKNARFIKLSSPGTRAFYTLSTEAVDFSSNGGEQVVKVSAYNTDATVTATSDNAKFTVAVDDYNVTISSAANDLEEAVTGNVTINVGNLESTIVKVTLAAKPASGEVEGGSDDFHTISSTNTSYVSGKTTAGWNYKNCAIFKGGTSDSSPSFKMIGDASNRALCMNGKTTAVGTITSPTFTTGCGTLKFNYGLPFSDTKIKFRVDIMQNGAVVNTFTINNASASKLTKYSHEEAINVAGDFQIVFTNLSPSNSTSNKDRTAIWDVEWTGYAN